MVPCQAVSALVGLLQVYLLAMLVYALVSWVPSIRGRWSEVLARVIEPVLLPVRRIIPPMGGLDISFLIVILLLQFLISAIRSTPCSL